jgi:hypothetical protein
MSSSNLHEWEKLCAFACKFRNHAIQIDTFEHAMISSSTQQRVGKQFNRMAPNLFHGSEVLLAHSRDRAAITSRVSPSLKARLITSERLAGGILI